MFCHVSQCGQTRKQFYEEHYIARTLNRFISFVYTNLTKTFLAHEPNRESNVSHVGKHKKRARGFRLKKIFASQEAQTSYRPVEHFRVNENKINQCCKFNSLMG